MPPAGEISPLRPLESSRSGSGQPIRCHERDLGQPIPEDAHAISVCLPTWGSVIAYEENDPLVRGSLRAGYPRFVLPSPVRELHERLAAGQGYAFGSRGAAARALAHVTGGGGSGRLESAGSAVLLVFGEDPVGKELAWQAWRHAGEGISSRSAAAILEGGCHAGVAGDSARASIRATLAAWHGVPEKCVFLFPSGMAAVSVLHQYLSGRSPGAGSVQIDFPYVDVARIQKHFGNACGISLRGEDALAGGLERALVAGHRAAIYCEVPANPLLDCADLPALAEIARRHGVPVVADDTVASVVNVGLLPHADFVTSSLSKWSTGSCNVLAGSVVVHPDSEAGAGFAAWLEEMDPAPLGDADAEVVQRGLPGLAGRIRAVNGNAAAAATFLREHPAIRAFWHPQLAPGHPYAKVARAGAGTGGLMSFALVGGELAAARFYDALAIDKGPSLGSDFSMACPYTLLAHYDELEHAAAWGVPRDLIRLSVGTEPTDWLVANLENAIRAVTS